MDRNGRVQQWLIIFLLGVALAMGLVIALLLRERRADQPTAEALPSAAAASRSAASSASASSASSTAQLPTVTAAPPEILPTPTFVPVGGPEEAPAPSQPAPSAAPVPAGPDPVVAAGTTVRLDDSVWQGGYSSARGYGGRSATWIYGAGTDYSSMQAALQLQSQPAGTATLTLEGMDSEDRAKTPIQITVNNTEIFNGPNPLPNDDLPLDSGTWAGVDVRFDAALLRSGTNIIRISNLKPGRFSLPPFFMLDYAVVTLPS
jgi:hypothetical protein